MSRLCRSRFAVDESFRRLGCAPVVLLVFMTLAAGSCAPVVVATAGITAAQVGATAFVRGELRTVVKAPLQGAWDATSRALDELGFDTRQKNLHVPPGRGYFYAAGNYTPGITIRLQQVTPTVVRIRIRIGPFGDEPMSQFLLAQIRERLSEAGEAGGRGPPYQ